MKRSNVILAIVAVFAATLTVTHGQEENTLPSFIFRDVDGTETTMTQVVHSTQVTAIINEQKAMNAKLDLILSKLGNPTVPPVEAPEYFINTATYEEILKIPGIGPVKAGALITARDTPVYKPFTSWQDLQNRVAGIGPSTLADIQASGVLLDDPNAIQIEP